MRIFASSTANDITITLEDTGEIARVLMALTEYNEKRAKFNWTAPPNERKPLIPVRILEVLEEALAP